MASVLTLSLWTQYADYWIIPGIYSIYSVHKLISCTGHKHERFCELAQWKWDRTVLQQSHSDPTDGDTVGLKTHDRKSKLNYTYTSSCSCFSLFEDQLHPTAFSTSPFLSNPIHSPFVFVLQCEPHSFSLTTKPPPCIFFHTGHWLCTQSASVQLSFIPNSLFLLGDKQLSRAKTQDYS